MEVLLYLYMRHSDMALPLYFFLGSLQGKNMSCSWSSCTCLYKGTKNSTDSKQFLVQIYEKKTFVFDIYTFAGATLTSDTESIIDWVTREVVLS